MYTQCPSCHTLFRIHEQQLSTAKGKVRCGQCNHVYNAQGTLLDSLPAEHVIPEQAPAEKYTPERPVEIERRATPIIETDEVLEIIASQNLAETGDVKNQDIDLTDDTTVNSDGYEADSKPSMSPPKGVAEDDWQMVDLGRHETEEENIWFDDDHGLPDDRDIDSNDESFDDITYDEPADEPTDEEEDVDLLRHVSDYLDDDAADELISTENASNILNEVEEQLSFSINAHETDDEQDTTGIGLPGNWLDDMDKPTKSNATSFPVNTQEEQELNDAILQSMEQPFPSREEPQAEKIEKPLFKSQQNIVLESSQHLIGQHDTDVPLRLRNSINIVPRVPRSALKWLLIFSAIVTLIALLMVQTVLFRSTKLANMYPEWQPFLIKTCEKLPCRDSSRQAVDQIQLMSRNISQHPRVKTALLIKAAILNRANFAQRYPNIQITLSDLTGSTVAQRTFKPEEYLGSLYHPFLQMKSGKPVHIALEVLDPGNTAINFEFKFL